MRVKLTLFLSAWMVFAINKLHAQVLIPGASDYYELGLLFSQYDYKGSARIQGIGSTQISLGGDLSSVLSNPAGLGFYNRSEISLTPSINNYTINSNYLNNSVEESQSRFNFDQVGATFHKNFHKETGFISGTFGFSFTKINEFNNHFSINGMNTLNDILDHFTQDANQINKDNWPLFTNMAYNVYLIDQFQDDQTNELFYDRTIQEYPGVDTPVDQLDNITTKGSQNQWSISYGANFQDVFYLGAGLGIQSLRYDIEKYYQENYASGNILQGMNLYENITMNGSGVNATFGFIARPIKQLTIGGSIITPTLITMSESSQFTMNSDFDNFNYDNKVLNLVNDEQYFEFDYQIKTPARFNAGATFFINKYGFITGDIEYVNYSDIRLDSRDDPMNDQDAIIRAEYTNVLNYKLGAEGRLGNFRARVGYSFTQSPFKYNDYGNRDVNKFSAGLGFRNDKFFTDVAANYARGKSNYSPYTFAPESNEALQEYYVTPVADIDYNNLSVALSFGFFF